MYSLSLSAAYLENVPQEVTQPDGTIIQCFATGDEYYNWLHDAENYTIIRNKNTGFFVYADPAQLENDRNPENNQLYRQFSVYNEVNLITQLSVDKMEYNPDCYTLNI